MSREPTAGESMLKAFALGATVTAFGFVLERFVRGASLGNLVRVVRVAQSLVAEVRAVSPSVPAENSPLLDEPGIPTLPNFPTGEALSNMVPSPDARSVGGPIIFPQSYEEVSMSPELKRKMREQRTLLRNDGKDWVRST